MDIDIQYNYWKDSEEDDLQIFDFQSYERGYVEPRKDQTEPNKNENDKPKKKK